MLIRSLLTQYAGYLWHVPFLFIDSPHKKAFFLSMWMRWMIFFFVFGMKTHKMGKFVIYLMTLLFELVTYSVSLFVKLYLNILWLNYKHLWFLSIDRFRHFWFEVILTWCLITANISSLLHYWVTSNNSKYKISKNLTRNIRVLPEYS